MDLGLYLNGKSAYILYKNEIRKPFFVNKARMLEEFFPLIGQGNHYICITRPRRFGKTMAADMIASFFQRHVMQVMFLTTCMFLIRRNTENI